MKDSFYKEGLNIAANQNPRADDRVALHLATLLF
jgi:hypothetical protein